MTAFLDTSVVIRYLTGDRPEVSRLVQEVIEETPFLILPEVVIAEAAYVLTTRYGLSRTQIVDALVDLLHRENIETLDAPSGFVLEALELCRPSGRVSFADALVWAAARAAGRDTVVYSLDRRFPAQDIDLRHPA